MQKKIADGEDVLEFDLEDEMDGGEVNLMRKAYSKR
jgi:hypothetical protein